MRIRGLRRRVHVHRVNGPLGMTEPSSAAGAVMGHNGGRQRGSETEERLGFQRGTMRAGALRCTSALRELGWTARRYTIASHIDKYWVRKVYTADMAG
jgi:hypothetical protein